MDEPWSAHLARARQELGISQAELAEGADISLESVKAYERGRRKPPRERLERLVAALKIPNADANKLREAAGYTQVGDIRTGPLETGRFYQLDELASAVKNVPWPEFVVNDASEVVAANAAAEAVWGIDFEHERATRPRAHMNLMAVAAEHHFAARVKNWDECVGVILSMFKATTPAPLSLDEPTPYFRQVIDAFLQGDQAFLARLIDVWNRTEPMEGKVRWTYPVVWDDPDAGQIRFLATVSLANDEQSTFFNDWIPTDAASWQAFERIRARYNA